MVGQLQEGEAYELYRDTVDNIAKSRLIESPNKAAFIDILRDVFHYCCAFCNDGCLTSQDTDIGKISRLHCVYQQHISTH